MRIQRSGHISAMRPFATGGRSYGEVLRSKGSTFTRASGKSASACSTTAWSLASLAPMSDATLKESSRAVDESSTRKVKAKKKARFVLHGEHAGDLRMFIKPKKRKSRG
jgi:hypothetical protein